MSKLVAIKNKIISLQEKQTEIAERLKKLEADYAAELIAAVQKKGVDLESLLIETPKPATHPQKPAAMGGAEKKGEQNNE